MRMFINVEHLDVICLKLGDRLFTPLTIFGLELKDSGSSTVKENPFLYCRRFPAFFVVVIF